MAKGAYVEALIFPDAITVGLNLLPPPREDSAKQVQDEDNLSFLSAVLGAFGSTMTAQTGNTTTLLVGLLIAAIAKTLPSLQDDFKAKGKGKAEDWILFGAAVLAAFAAGIEAQKNLVSQFPYPYVPIGLLLAGIVLKCLFRQPNGKLKREDKLTIGVALGLTLLLVEFGPVFGLSSPTGAAVGVFFAFLTKSLTSDKTS